MADTLVSDVDRRLYIHDLDAETLRWISDELKEHADSVRQWEEEYGPRKMRHARSSLLRVWAERFGTDANRMEDL